MYEHSLAEIGKHLRTRALSCEALVERAIESYKEDLGAYRVFDPERARKEAKAADAALRAGRDFGPLHGIPISVKDLYGVPGWDTYAGTSERLPEKWEHAGPVVQTFLDGFAIVMGKTHTVELAFSGIGINNHWGTPKNPWDEKVHRIPGGSSSGAGVSLCEGTAYLALGTDTAGSVRVPASMTGNVALKTTKGRWSTDGIVPLSSSLDTPGVLARTIEDLCVAFEAIEGAPVPEPPPLSQLRLGVLGAPFFDELGPGIGEAFERAVTALGNGGASVRPVDLPEAVQANDLFRRGGVAAVELWAFLTRELPAWRERLDPVVRLRVEDVANQPAHEYVARLEEMRRLQDAADEHFEGFDAWLTPTVATAPPPVADLQDLDVYKRTNLLALRNTSIVSCLGQCAVSLPVAFDADGLPIGLQIIGRRGADDRLLAVSRRLERSLGRPNVGTESGGR